LRHCTLLTSPSASLTSCPSDAAQRVDSSRLYEDLAAHDPGSELYLRDPDQQRSLRDQPMSLPLEALESEVLRLPTAEREKLPDRVVVASLDSDWARDAAWDQVAATREATLDTGSAQEVAGHETIARRRAKLG
jgi:hypothetical protein